MAYSMPRQMLLPVVCGRCYSHLYIFVQADVIAYDYGRCYCQYCLKYC